MVMERTASTLNAKEQRAPASAALAEIGPVYIRERSADYSRSQSQLSQKLSPDSSPSWILYAARLSCQDAAKEVVASSSCEVGGVSLCAGGTTFMVRNLFSLLCGFLAAAAFKGVNTLSSRKLKLNVSRDWRKEAGRIPYKIPMHLISRKTK